MPKHPLLCHFTRGSFIICSVQIGIRRLVHQRKKINEDCMTYAKNIKTYQYVLSTTVCVVD